MKSSISILTLAFLASAAVAQTAPSAKSSAPKATIGASWSTVSTDALPGDSDGYTLNARVNVFGNVGLIASWSDVSLDAAPPGVDVTRYTIGLAADFAAGPGTLTVSAAHGNTEIDTLVDVDQLVLSVGYSQSLGNGFTLGLAAQYVDLDDPVDDSHTAAILTLGYSPAKNLTLSVSYATEDTLMALPDADSTVTIGVQYGF